MTSSWSDLIQAGKDAGRVQVLRNRDDPLGAAGNPGESYWAKQNSVQARTHPCLHTHSTPSNIHADSHTHARSAQAAREIDADPAWTTSSWLLAPKPPMPGAVTAPRRSTGGTSSTGLDKDVFAMWQVVVNIHIHYVYSNAEHSMLHRFACRHCVKRDKQRPQSAVPSTPHQQTLRCSSHLPQVGRQSAAACRSSTDLVQTIPAALPAGNLQVTHIEAVSVSQRNHTCICMVNWVHMCWFVYVYKY